MRDWLKALPILLAASALLIAATAEKEGQRSAQMLAAGFIVLGLWAGTEIAFRFLTMTKRVDDPPGDEDGVPPGDVEGTRR